MWKLFILLLVCSSVYNEEADDESQTNSDEMFDDDDEASNHSIADNLYRVGDMLLTKEQFDYLYKRDPNKRVGYTMEFKRWPNGIVPIKIHVEDYSEEFIQRIKDATNYIMDRSCVQFLLDFNSEEFPNYVSVNLGDGKSCRSQVGNFRRGEQQLHLHEKCTNGSVVHELLHTLGFLHMHTAPNRDKHVEIIFNNIKPFAMNNFKKASGFVGMFKTPYDFESIMHYSQHAFAKNHGGITINPKANVQGMGQRKRMTAGDVTRLNRMYRCPKGSEGRKMETHQRKIPVESETTNNPISTRNFGMRMAVDGMYMKSSDDERKVSRISMQHSLKFAAKEIINFLNPICSLRENLDFLVNNVDLI